MADRIDTYEEITERILQALERVAQEGLATFEREGYPDSWHGWQRAEEDARSYLQRYEFSPIGNA